MTTRSWIRHLLARPVTRRNKPRSAARTPRSKRPLLELLEDRVTPAQITVPVSGFNQDVIWAASEPSALAGTTAGYDAAAPNGGWVMYEAGVPGGNTGLPASGAFASTSNSFVNFQLASYTANNVLMLGYNEPTTGTLALTTPSTFSSLNLLDSAVNGNASFAFTLNFGDGSSTTVSNNVAPDWFFNSPYALNGFDRVGRITGGFEGDTADPRFYELDYRLAPADQVKLLDSITFTYQGAVSGNFGNGFGIFAVSGNNAPATPSTFVVNNPTDTPVAGKTDLRQAIALANSTAGDNTITFDPTVFATPQTITLGGSQLELANLTGTETIVGPKAGVTVSGGGSSRVFQVDPSVTASISGLTISGGSAGSANGGGLSNLGTATLTSCTVSGNSATSGGGLNSTGTLALTNCTISANSASFLAGGLFATGPAVLTNTIVAGDSARADIDIDAPSASGTNNMIGSGFAGSLRNGVNGNLVGVANPLLAPLGNYGGAAQTMALLPGSPAIDAGTGGAGIPTTDQRGLPRVGAVDIGAFESQGFTMTAVAGSTPQTSPILTPFAPLALTVTAHNPVEPVNGGVVSFVANSVKGATALLSAPSAVIAGGQAAVAAEPDNAVGSYTVVASAAGSSPATFALTNAGPVLTSLVVNTTSDSLFPGAGLLSLREAVAFANLDSAGISAITFDKTVFATPQTIDLTGTQLELSNTGEAETITGPKAGVTVDGGGLSRVFQVDPSVTASISALTISGGKVNGNGGGLANKGTATLTDCTISGNSASAGRGGLGNRGNGGGVYNSGTATLTDCTISGNSANGGFSFGGGSGGGVYNNGTATLTNCTVSGNAASAAFIGGTGGGVGTGSFAGGRKGTTTLTNCTVSGNSGFGGVSNYSTTTLTNCTISGNSGAGVLSSASVTAAPGVTSLTTLTNCTVSGNSGPGVFTSATGIGGGGSYSIGQGATVLTNCTVSGNSSSGSGGGLLTRGGTTTATNTTISGNKSAAYGYGGGGGAYTSGFNFGVNVYGTTNLTNCTVSGNSTTGNGGGLYTAGFGTATLTNCSVTGNTAVNGGGAFTQGRAGTIFNYSSYSFSIQQYAATINLSNCTVSGNTATGNGGGLDTQAFGTATLTNCTVSGNSAVNGGGAFAQGQVVSVYLYPHGYVPVTGYGATNLKNCTVSGNAATASGGGLDNASLGTATVTGTNVKKNSAAVGGGMANQGTLSVASSNIINNTATSAGGGLSTTGGSATLANCVINTNRVVNPTGTALGGGIDCENSTLALTNCTVNANQANGVTAKGGGVYALNSTVTVKNSTVNGNKANGSALGEGGGIYSSNTAVTLLATNVKGNKATTDSDDLFNGP